MKNGALSEALRQRMLAWRHCGFSADNEVRVPAEDIEVRKKSPITPADIGHVTEHNN